ncbi:MAG: ATP-binding protein [Acidobacteriota bacterium]
MPRLAGPQLAGPRLAGPRLAGPRLAVPRLARRVTSLLAILFSMLVSGESSLANESAPQASPQEIGLPLLIAFDSRTYGAHSQNWAAVQDDRGVMYFGNGDGVLRFDGVEWQTVEVANASIVRSLAKDADGRIYVGAVNELGYLESDALGNPTYVSLKDRLPADEAELADVWRIFVIDESVFFWTVGKLMRWHQGELRSWPLESRRAPCSVRGQLFNNHPELGLTVWTGEGFEALPGGEALADRIVITMAPLGDHQILIGTSDGSLLRLSLAPDRSSATVEPFASEADAYLARHKLYQIQRLPDGTFGLATFTGGLVILDHRGQERARISQTEGLPDNSVWSLFVDRDRGLWLGLNRGLARLEVDSAVTQYGETAGLEGTVEAITRHRGALYAATSVGLYRLQRQQAEWIAGDEAPHWSLASVDDAASDPRLLIGTQAGVFELVEGRLERRTKSRNVFYLYPSTRHPGRVYIGEQTGLYVMTLEDGRWLDRGRVPGIDLEIRSIHEDDDGHLWLGSHFHGVLRLDLAPGTELEPRKIDQFGHEHGWPRLKSIKVRMFGDRLLFPSPDGLYQFDSESQTFAPSPLFSPDSPVSRLGILRARPDAHANLWLSLHGGENVVALPQPDGTYGIDRESLRRVVTESTHAILPEPSGVAWLGGVDGLFRVDTRHPTFDLGVSPPAELGPPEDATFSALIRRVTLANAERTVLYRGEPVSSSDPLTAGPGAEPDSDRSPGTEPALTYDQSSLRFEYAMPRFEGWTANRYRSRMVGLEDAWTDWTQETYRDFTALREGHYRFEVQGRDIYHRPSRVAAYTFRILPPWYRTWWAYVIYAIGLTIAASAIFGWLLRRARLEMRLVQLAEANALMQRTDAERQQLVRQLEAKNADLERVIYGVSHDLKSPLITIRGFLGLMQKDFEEGKLERVQHDMERIQGAAAKMSTLVNELLELSMVGRVANDPQEISLSEIANEAAEQVAGQIAERGVAIEIAPDLPTVTGDRQRLLAMMQNLIENAVKYMGDQPEPRVEVATRLDGETRVFLVRDNGQGVEPAYQDKIFGLFERLSTDVDGTGVGLALVQRIVRVHGGRVWVESEGEGQGSTFCFTLA